MIQTALIPDPMGPDAIAEVRRQVAALGRNQTVIGDNSLVGSTVLVAGSVTTGSLAAGSVTTSILAAGAVVTSTLAAGAVTAVKIQAGTITSNEIAAATITGANIAAGTVTATNIAAGTITSTLLAADSVTSGAIVSGAVTATKISVSQLSAIAADLGTITAGTVTGATLRTASSGKRVVLDSTGITGYGGTGSTVVFNFDTTTGNLALTGTVQSGSTVPTTTLTGTLTTTQIGTGNVTSTNILDATIAGADIAANTITASNILAATITATELATDSVTSVKILANTIVAGDIASGTITATQIAAGTITADRMNVTSLSAITANLGTITAGTLTGTTIQTAASGARLVLSGSTLTGYNSGGTQLVQLDPARGLVLQGGATSVGGDLLQWIDSGGTVHGRMNISDSGVSATNSLTWNAGVSTKQWFEFFAETLDSWPQGVGTTISWWNLSPGGQSSHARQTRLTLSPGGQYEYSSVTTTVPSIQASVYDTAGTTKHVATLLDANGDSNFDLGAIGGTMTVRNLTVNGSITAAGSWTAPASFGSPWASNGTWPVRCRKDALGVVWLRGLCNAGGSWSFASNGLMFTLPSSSYYPSTFLRFSLLAFDPNDSNWKTVYVSIDNTNGQVVLSGNSGGPGAVGGMSGATNCWVSLDTVSFPTW